MHKWPGAPFFGSMHPTGAQKKPLNFEHCLSKVLLYSKTFYKSFSKIYL